MPTMFTDSTVTMDVMCGKCHVLLNKHGKRESVYCADTAFDALNYITTNYTSLNIQGYSLDISDIAMTWIDLETYEAVALGVRNRPQLFSMCA